VHTVIDDFSRAAPFHSWAPDAYQGAPTAVTAFMAACTKLGVYAATKWGLNCWSEALRQELLPDVLSRPRHG
jgi:NADH:ubiquinone oxidoreductase subunit 4 (subunit M)